MVWCGRFSSYFLNSLEANLRWMDLKKCGKTSIYVIMAIQLRSLLFRHLTLFNWFFTFRDSLVFSSWRVECLKKKSSASACYKSTYNYDRKTGTHLPVSWCPILVMGHQVFCWSSLKPEIPNVRHIRWVCVCAV